VAAAPGDFGSSCFGGGDEGGHSAGGCAVAAVGVKIFGVGKGAEVGQIDLTGGEPGLSQLHGDGAGEVDVVFGVLGVGGADGGGWAEVADEFRGDFGAYFEVVEADAGADGGDEGIGARAADLGHALDSEGEDAGDDAAPAGVDGGDNFAVICGEENGDAVSVFDAEEAGGVIGHQGIGAGAAGEDVAWVDGADVGLVDLADPAALAAGRAEGGGESAVVFFDVFGGVFEGGIAGDAEVEGGEGGGGNTADAGGEGVGDMGLIEQGRGVEGDVVLLAAEEHWGGV